MTKYKFPEFDLEFTDPLISVNEDSIRLKVSKMTIDVMIVIEVNGARFSPTIEDVSVTNLSYEGSENLLEKVMIKLQDFIVL
jgi:hypothetical protein